METARDGREASSRAARWALLIAVVAGSVHGLFSLYWAAGGDWLVDTLGTDLVDAFAGRRWLLFPVAAVKIAFALLPVAFDRLSPLVRRVCWAGAAVLVAWGGGNTILGNLTLTGAVNPAGGYDRDGMMGHAWLWDPLFLIWGVALALALCLTRRRATASRPPAAPGIRDRRYRDE